MLEFLYSVDVSVFYFINHTLSNPFLDKFFTFITEVKHWYIAYIILWCITFFKGGRLGKVASITLLILIAFSDQLSSSFIKNIFERMRPCNALPDVNILVACTGSFSFPSSHAVNNFAAAVFFYKIYPKYKWILLSIATIMALSRPYVGVHYPSDILVGALLGALIGYVFSIIALIIYSYWNKYRPIKSSLYKRVEFK